MAASLLEPGFWQSEWWVAGYFSEDYFPHWVEIYDEPTKIGGDDVPAGARVRPSYEYQKEFFDLPEIEKQPSVTFALRQEQKTQMAMQAELKRIREEEVQLARSTVAHKLDADTREFDRQQKRKQQALINLGHTKTEKIQHEPMQMSRNRTEMRKQMKARRDEKKRVKGSNQRILKENTRQAKERVRGETQQFNKEKARVRQPLEALELAHIANRKTRKKKKRAKSKR